MWLFDLGPKWWHSTDYMYIYKWLGQHEYWISWREHLGRIIWYNMIIWVNTHDTNGSPVFWQFYVLKYRLWMACSIQIVEINTILYMIYVYVYIYIYIYIWYMAHWTTESADVSGSLCVHGWFKWPFLKRDTWGIPQRRCAHVWKFAWAWVTWGWRWRVFFCLLY